MPVKIVKTNPTEGEIKELDLKKMKNDFINEAEVLPYNGRKRLLKKFSVAVMKDDIKELIRHYEELDDIDIINMNFSVTPNPFFACNGDASDSMTIVVEAASFINESDPSLGYISHVNAGDYVVIPGYKNAPRKDDKSGGGNGGGSGSGGGTCCPASNP